MRLTVLVGLTAWCHAQPHPSLLQVSSRQTAMEKAEAESRSQTLSGFQKLTNTLVEEYKSGEPPINGTVRTAIDDVLTFIEGFYPRADAAHVQDLASIQRCEDQHCAKSCPDEFNSTTISRELTRLDNQKSELRTCIETNKANEENNADNCYAYDWYRANIDLPDCVYNGHFPGLCSAYDPSEEHPYLGDFCDNMIKADTESQELAKMEECLVAFNEWFNGPGESGDAWTLPRSPQHHILVDQQREEGIWQLYQACTRPDPPIDIPPIDTFNPVCQGSVDEYHRDHCEYALVLNHECDELQHCNKNCADDCDICDAIKIKAGARKADNETGERIVCLLSVLIDTAKPDKTAALQECTNQAAIDEYELKASHFNLDCDGFASLSNVHAPPDECQNAHLPISCSSAYMEELLQMPVAGTTLAEFDLYNLNRQYETMWNSCACGHQCNAAAAQDNTPHNTLDADLLTKTDFLKKIKDQVPDEYQNSAKCAQTLPGGGGPSGPQQPNGPGSSMGPNFWGRDGENLHHLSYTPEPANSW